MKTIKKLKNRKSAGDDGIPNEFIKHDCPKLTEVTKLLKKSFGEKKIPHEWKTNVLILLFKKGNKKSKTFRDIF